MCWLCATNLCSEDFLDEPHWLKQRKGLIKELLCDTAASALWVRLDDLLAWNNSLNCFYSVYKEHLGASQGLEPCLTLWVRAVALLLCHSKTGCVFSSFIEVLLWMQKEWVFPSRLCPPLQKEPGNVCLICNGIGIGYQTQSEQQWKASLSVAVPVLSPVLVQGALKPLTANFCFL